MTTLLRARKHRRRSLAGEAFEANFDTLADLWRMDVRAWLGRLPAEVADQLGNHRPEAEQINEFALGEFTCGVCVKTPGWSCTCCGTEPDQMHPFPCPALVKAGPALPPLPKPATLRDFWDEPFVTVVLNHPTTVPLYRGQRAGVPFSVPWSHADQMHKALRAESQDLVERYR